MKTKLSSSFGFRHLTFSLLVLFTLFTSAPYARTQTMWGQCLSFDGTNDYVQAPAIPLANASFTIEAWARRLSSDTIDMIAGEGSIGSEKGFHFGFHQIVQNKFVFAFYDDDLFTTNSYTDTEWHHWAGTYDAATKQRRIYRDGLLVASDVALTNFQGSGPFLIGCPPWGPAGGAFHGSIDDVRVWSVARTPSQIAENFRTPLTGAESNLVAYWRFDEGAGSVAFDSTPNTSNGTLLNGLQRTSSTVPPIWGHALSFDGTDDHLTMPAGIWFSNTFTIEAWVFVRSYNNWSRLLDFGNGAPGENVILSLTEETNGHPNLRKWVGANRQAIVAPAALPTNQWVHLAATLSNNVAVLYVNGAAVVSASDWTPASPVLRTNNYIARSPWVGNDYANFMLDELRIWNVARSQPEIQTDMSSPLAGKEAGLVAYYRFDEGIGTTAFDMTTNHLDGTLTNGPTWVVDSVLKIWDGSSNGLWSVGANWVGGVAPVDGDHLVFPGGVANLSNTNDLVNLQLRSIIFTTNSYTLRGNAFTLTNGIVAANLTGTNTIQNNIIFSVVDQIVDVTSSLTLSGVLSGSVGFIKNGVGTVTFSGTSANTYSGTTYAQAGTLLLNKSYGVYAVPANLVISSIVRLANTEQIVSTADVLVQGGGLFDLASSYTFVDTLRGSGFVTFGTFGYLIVGMNNGTSTFDGVMSGPGFAAGYTLYKGGSGTFTLNGSNTYSNRTDVDGGKLVINGSQPQSPVRVYPGSTVGGSGTVGNITAAGGVAPGSSPGMLTCSNVALLYSGTPGTFEVELTGPVTGTDYDQLTVRGTNNLANAALNVLVNFTKPVGIGQQFVIINNDGADAITGTFAGLTNGATFSTGGYDFRIDYNGGSGNDVVLTLTSLPADVGAVTVATGNGNHAIDPNECNQLALVIINKSGTLMTGVTATLSTRTPLVMIHQPYSGYANVPAHGNGTNLVPFQIATLANFICGNDIYFELTVNSTSHGRFIVPFVLHSGGVSPVSNRYDVAVSANIPDLGTIESTNVVAGFAGPLARVGVSFWITHPWDSDLDISLITPEGVVIDLSSGNGAGANFGSGCSPDSSRTTFDDEAAVSILDGAPPYVGTFRPEGSLAAAVGGTANGNWRLRVTDAFGGTTGALRCWSLFLYPLTCGTGSGVCDVCSPITGSIMNTDLVEANRIFRDGSTTSCGSPKAWPGVAGTNMHCDQYTFTNTMAEDACASIKLTSDCSYVHPVAYLNSFDPANIALNYLGDPGSSATGVNIFSVVVPAGARLVVVVSETTQNAGCSGYTLEVSGLPCPPPVLNVEPAPAKNVRVFWPTWAGDYQLEATHTLVAPAWLPLTNEPLVGNGAFNVTNFSASSNLFYRLHKP